MSDKPWKVIWKANMPGGVALLWQELGATMVIDKDSEVLVRLVANRKSLPRSIPKNWEVAVNDRVNWG